jgi:ketosteroid isomerase-like protein
MNAEPTLRHYFASLYGGDWESLLADDMQFINNGKASPRGKDAYVAATRRFMQVARSVEVETLIADGERAVALARYGLVSPKGNTGSCRVAEFFEVKQGKIRSNEIVFDLAAFQQFMAAG